MADLSSWWVVETIEEDKEFSQESKRNKVLVVEETMMSLVQKSDAPLCLFFAARVDGQAWLGG